MSNAVTRRYTVTLGLTTPFLAHTTHAQPTYPTRTVRFIVPFPPGQAADIFARLIAERLTAVWKQQVIVDNKSGGGGIPGTEAGKAAAPDGYTFLVATSGTFGVNPSLYPELPYRPLVDWSTCRRQAGHRPAARAAGDRGASLVRREHDRRADRAGAQGARQDLLRLGRSRHGAASQHGALQFAAFIAKDMATWAEVVKATGTKPG